VGRSARCPADQQSRLGPGSRPSAASVPYLSCAAVGPRPGLPLPAPWQFSGPADGDPRVRNCFHHDRRQPAEGGHPLTGLQRSARLLPCPGPRVPQVVAVAPASSRPRLTATALPSLNGPDCLGRRGLAPPRTGTCPRTQGKPGAERRASLLNPDLLLCLPEPPVRSAGQVGDQGPPGEEALDRLLEVHHPELHHLGRPRPPERTGWRGPGCLRCRRRLRSRTRSEPRRRCLPPIRSRLSVRGAGSLGRDARPRGRRQALAKRRQAGGVRRSLLFRGE